MTYRDPLAGLRGQVAVKRAALAAKRCQVSAALRALLDDALYDRLGALEARCLGPDPLREDDRLADADLATLTAVDADVDTLAAAYEEALAVAPGLRGCADVAHDPPRPEISEPWLDEDGPQLALRRAVQARILALDPDSFLRRWGDYGYLSRLAVEDVRLTFSFELDVTALTFVIEGFRASLRASIPRAFRPLHLRPEKTADALKKAVGLAHELTLGEEALDEALFVTGAPRSLPLLDIPRVRAALRILAPRRLSLHADGGMVLVTWAGSGDAANPFGGRRTDPAMTIFPPAAIDLVVGLKRALVDE